ncbi:hypothetical protein D3C77_772000 [compost metagenome]|jgi:CBS domain-containing protein
MENIRRIPIVDDLGLLVGIATADDLAGLLADDLNRLARLTRQQVHDEHDVRAQDL